MVSLKPRSTLPRLARDERGIASVEFAVVASIVLTLLLAAYDIGNVVLQSSQLSQAVRAGAEFAISFPTDTPGIQRTVTDALPINMQSLVPTANIIVTVGCSSGGAATTSTDPCNLSNSVVNWASCPTGTNERFVQVTASVSAGSWFTTPLPITRLGAPSACYVARVQ